MKEVEVYRNLLDRLYPIMPIRPKIISIRVPQTRPSWDRIRLKPRKSLKFLSYGFLHISAQLPLGLRLNYLSVVNFNVGDIVFKYSWNIDFWKFIF